MKYVDLVIIGGGSAGMAAAIQAKKEGIDNLLIIERDESLGGILNQCIHNGFGLTEFKEELSGPEYLQRFVDAVDEMKIPYVLNTNVIEITKDKLITVSSKNGFEEIQAKSIILATGCFERSAGMIALPGDRCSGVITAGTAQKLLNIHGLMCGKRVVILGSGDIGLIMARRLTLEGAKVICVTELMPYSNGLNRNIAQCLNDFDIPLYLSRSVSKVIGKDRLEKVILSKVDEKGQFIKGTEMEIECDTLILSIGLIPEISLLNDIMMDPRTVNQYMETNIEGVFKCGNCAHVHDVVDFVSEEGRLAGHGASLYIKGLINNKGLINVIPKDGVSYVVPNKIKQGNEEPITFKFRVRKPVKDTYVVIESNGKEISKVFKTVMIPSEMVQITLNYDKLSNLMDDITFRLEERK